MGYNIKKIDSVKAIHVPTRIKKSEIEKFEISEEDFEDLMRFKKAGAQIRIVITIGNVLKIENLSLKRLILMQTITKWINDSLMRIRICGVLMTK